MARLVSSFEFRASYLGFIHHRQDIDILTTETLRHRGKSFLYVLHLTPRILDSLNPDLFFLVHPV